MTRQAPDFDLYKCNATTYNNLRYVSELRTKLTDYDNDPKKEERQTKGLCRYCFYVHTARIGGCAMTKQPCAICLQDQMYGSTATDLFCTECAIHNHVCKRCGADTKDRTRRRSEFSNPKESSK